VGLPIEARCCGLYRKGDEYQKLNTALNTALGIVDAIMTGINERYVTLTHELGGIYQWINYKP
jgi:hypothetical protein